MQRYIILAQTKENAAALSAVRELLTGEAPDDPNLTPPPVVIDAASFDREGGVRAYQLLVDRLAALTSPYEHDEVTDGAVVLVDTVRPSRLTAVAESGTWNHIVAMLILTFPEVRWVFGAFQYEDAAGEENAAAVSFPQHEHDLASLFGKPPFTPLLDPTGLREWVKRKTNEALRRMSEERGKRGYLLPERRSLAAVLDDEYDFAFLHAYTAYRYGFRVSVVTSWRLMEHLFGPEARGPHPYSLLLEDMRLTFPDKPNAVHLSDLAERGRFCPLLANENDKSKWRYLITTGQMGGDRALVYHNRKYLEANASHNVSDILYKPVGGIFDLWKEAGLYEALTQHARHGNACGFVWPPEFKEAANYEGHGSPGKLALIAKTLIGRAAAVKAGTNSASGLGRGAVLALDAAELLGGKTPTLTLSALSLKNEFEVSAECEFMGTGYHVGLKRRLDELDADVKSVTRWYHEDIRARSALEAKTKVLSRLNIVFSESGRVEESLECLSRMRGYNRKLSRPEKKYSPAWITHPLLAYCEWLLASFPRLILMTMCWLAVFSLINWWLPSRPFDTFQESGSHALEWFFGEPFIPAASAPPRPYLQMFSWLVVLTGVLHVGLLISYLYSLISRK
jgi:hypothetical protein